MEKNNTNSVGNIQQIKNEKNYNQAKTWQIAFFSGNSIAPNLYMLLYMFISYYATGVAGLAVVVVGTAMSVMRVWDAITDPIIGYVIDKTETKIGKFRPSIIIGNILMLIPTVMLFRTLHIVPSSIRLIYFILVYGIYIIGYTIQNAANKAGQTVLTNDPKQRPLFAFFATIYSVVLMRGMALVLSGYLVPKHGGFKLPLFNELVTYIVIASAALTLLAVIGIWEKDVKENWGLGKNAVKVKFKDYWPIIKENRAIQMLIIAASTDKLAATVAGNAVVGVMIYGILIGNYAISGQLGLIAAIPIILLSIYSTRYARKFGLKKTLIIMTWACIVLNLGFFGFFYVADFTSIELGFSLTSIIFFAFYVLQQGIRNASSSVVIPMIADCTDYEVYRTGKYVPGMMGTLFSFVDKLFSSLSATIVAVILTLFGYKDILPQVGDVATTQIFWIAMLFYFGLPILGWIASLIAMKFYPLDVDFMKTIQEENSKVRNADVS